MRDAHARTIVAIAAVLAMALAAAQPSQANAAQLTAGGAETCLLRNAGNVVCWGVTYAGTSPQQPFWTWPGPASSIATGSTYACAVLTTTFVRCWGLEDDGELGNIPGTGSHPSPTLIPLLYAVRSVSAGIGHACVIDPRHNNEVVCWGRGFSGQLGTGRTPTSARPNDAARNLKRVRTVAVGGDHTCALKHDGTVFCWGARSSVPDGRIPSRRDALIPTKVRRVSSVAALAAGTAHTCAATTGGRVVCWGDDADGQSGRWPRRERTGTWTVPGVYGATSVAAGGRHTCAIVAGGSVVCWGANDFGQSGNGPIGGAVTPTPVPGLRPAVALALGDGHSCALHADETVSCWGNANGFQVNDVPPDDTATPVTITSLPG